MDNAIDRSRGGLGLGLSLVKSLVHLTTRPRDRRLVRWRATGDIARQAADSRHYSVTSETDQVRVLRVSYGPGEKSVMHEHPPVVAVFLSEARFRFTFPDGRSEERTGKRGDTIMMPAEQHLPENIGDNRADVVVIELKNRL